MVLALPLEDIFLRVLSPETLHVAAEKGGVLFLLEGGGVVGSRLFGDGVLAEIAHVLATRFFGLLHH